MNAPRGFTLIEAAATLALLGVALALVLPDFTESRRTGDFVRLARQVAADALRCRMEALSSCRSVGLLFAEVKEQPYYIMVADGDGDGVSRADFVRGIDRALGPKVWVEFMRGGTRLGTPPGWSVPDPDGNGTLDDRGLHIGNSNIVSFAVTGGATPSSVYFNDGHDRVLAVRVHGGLGRVRSLLWRRGWVEWHEIKL